MALTLPSLDQIQKQNPKAGEALKKIQDYVNLNISPAAGNKVSPPSGFVNPTRS